MFTETDLDKIHELFDTEINAHIEAGTKEEGTELLLLKRRVVNALASFEDMYSVMSAFKNILRTVE